MPSEGNTQLRVDAPEFIPQVLPLVVPPALPPRFPAAIPPYIGLAPPVPPPAQDPSIPAVAPLSAGGPQVLLTVPPEELRNHYGITAGTGRSASSTQVPPPGTDSSGDEQQEGVATAPLDASEGFQAVRLEMLKYRACLGALRKPRCVRLRALPAQPPAGSREAPVPPPALVAAVAPQMPGGVAAGTALLHIVQGKVPGGEAQRHEESAALLQLLHNGGGKGAGRGHEGRKGGWGGHRGEWGAEEDSWKAQEKAGKNVKAGGATVVQSRVDIRKAAAAARQSLSNQSTPQKPKAGR